MQKIEKATYQQMRNFITDNNGQRYNLDEALESFIRRYVSSQGSDTGRQAFDWQTDDDDAEPNTFYIQVHATTADEGATFIYSYTISLHEVL